MQNRRGGSRSMSARLRSIRFIAVAVALTLVAVGTVTDAGIAPAYATEYPSWNDVVNARNSEAATVKEIARITALLAELRVQVEATQADAEAKGEIYQEADLKFQEAALKAVELKGQADAAKALAEQSKQRAGEIVAQQYRSGNGDVTTNLFVNASRAKDLLYSYGMADKFTEQTAGIYEKALQDQNTAQALTDQADIAEVLRKELKIAAQVAFDAAQKAAEAAAAALNEQEEREGVLQAQLVVLTARRAVTENDYIAGVRARLAAAAQLGAGEVSASGWARPVGGHISSGFGYRLHPKYGTWRLHTGTDLANPCGTRIYAAHTGTVIYAGRFGTYGNWVLIDHGNGISTGYAHIVDGGILVRAGQQVEVGQNIARVGSTGASTGCHLHFEVRRSGVAENAVPFMRGQGIGLG